MLFDLLFEIPLTMRLIDLRADLRKDLPLLTDDSSPAFVSPDILF